MLGIWGTRLYALVKIHLIVHSRAEHFTVHKLYLNKQNLREIYVRLSDYSMKIAESTIARINQHLNMIIERMGKNKVEELIELNNLFNETSRLIMEEDKSC